MNPGLLVGGMAVVLLAGLVLVFFVIAPPAPRVASDRRLSTWRRARVDAHEGDRAHDRRDRLRHVEANESDVRAGGARDGRESSRSRRDSS